MYTFAAKTWALTVPDEVTVESQRDYVSIRFPDQHEARLTVLHGDAHVTDETIEAYARPFYPEMQERVDLKANGWQGFVFWHGDKKDRGTTQRGYFMKGRYLLIMVLRRENGIAADDQRYIIDILNNLKLKE